MGAPKPIVIRGISKCPTHQCGSGKRGRVEVLDNVVPTIEGQVICLTIDISTCEPHKHRNVNSKDKVFYI